MVLEGGQPSSAGLFTRLRQSFRRRTLVWALAFSVAVHAALIGWRFADPESFNRVFEDTSLEVILVSARSDAAPDHAEALAQVRLAGARLWAPVQDAAADGRSTKDQGGRVAAAAERERAAAAGGQPRLPG